MGIDYFFKHLAKLQLLPQTRNSTPSVINIFISTCSATKSPCDHTQVPTSTNFRFYASQNFTAQKQELCILLATLTLKPSFISSHMTLSYFDEEIEHSSRPREKKSYIVIYILTWVFRSIVGGKNNFIILNGFRLHFLTLTSLLFQIYLKGLEYEAR